MVIILVRGAGVQAAGQFVSGAANVIDGLLVRQLTQAGQGWPCRCAEGCQRSDGGSPMVGTGMVKELPQGLS